MALGYVTPPSEAAKIHHQQQNTEVYVGDNCVGKGVVYITEDNVIWQCLDGTGFELLYPSIQLHAISRDKNAFAKDCLYLMVECASSDINSASADQSQRMDHENEDDDEEEEEEGDVGSCSEVRFCPDNVVDLEPMFLAMNRCQELNPDPNIDGDSSEDEDEGQQYFHNGESGGGDQYIFNSMPAASSNDDDNGEEHANGANVALLQQLFTADGQFSAEVMHQIQSGHPVNTDLYSSTAHNGGDTNTNYGDEMDTNSHADGN